MKSLLSPVLSLCVCMMSYSSELEGSELLASFGRHSSGGVSPCELTPVEFYVGIDGPPPSFCIPIGRDLVAWTDGESGSYDITPSNEPLFAEFASVLTNGANDNFMLLTRMLGNGGDGGTVASESHFFPSGHDLAGNQLDFVRLDVSNVHIWTIDPSVHWQGWSADVTYEFWGTPLPEPATALPILFTALMGCRRRRRRSL